MYDDFFLSGIYYGYPTCCIDEFIFCVENGSFMQREKRKLNGTGYVPCEECNQKSERDLLKTINDNRLHWQKFPKSGPNKSSFVEHSRWVAEMFLESLED
jgi:hypothetical protein